MDTDAVIGITLAVMCFIVIFPLAITHASFKMRQLHETWRKLAERHGLQFEQKRGQVSVEGSLRGREVRLGVVGSDKSPAFFIEVAVHGDLPDGLSLSRRGWRRPSVGGADGALNRLVHLGDWAAEAMFDGNVKVKAKDADAADRYLDGRRRAAAARLTALGGELVEGKVKLPVNAFARDLEVMEGALSELRDIARAFDAGSPRRATSSAQTRATGHAARSRRRRPGLTRAAFHGAAR